MGRFYLRIARPLLTGAAPLQTVPARGRALATLGVCVLFVTKDVTVKLLPFDNKSEIQVVVDLPQGATRRGHRTHSAWPPPTGSRICRNWFRSRPMPAPPRRSTSTALCATTICATSPEQGDLQVNLTPKAERTRASHAIALDIRQRLARSAALPGTVDQGRRGAAGPAGARDAARRDLRPRRSHRRAVAAQSARGFRKASISSSMSTTPSTSRRAAALCDRPGESRILRRRGAGGLRHDRRASSGA